ncbi:MAG: hypothetical protein ACE5GN_04380, partial [Waddliaceae bacterium]
MLRISTPKNQESSAAFLGSAAYNAGPVRDEEGDAPFMPTDTPQDRLIAQLYSKGVVDEFGHFIPTIDFSLPPFESAQMDCVRSFLESPFEIHDHSGAFLLKISLLEILQFFSKNFGTMIQNIDIVGGFVRSLLLMSPNYCKRALGSLGVEDVDNVITDGLFDDFHRKLPDYDIRIWAPGAQTGDLYRFTGALVAYFVSKMGNRPQSWVEKNAFSKFNVVLDGRNRFSIASFGQRELLFVRDLERSHLFLLDALRINVFDGYFFSKDPVIQGDYAKGWQSIIDLLAKVIHVDQLQTINHFGFPMLMSYLSRGYVLGDVQVGGMNVLESLIKRTLIPSSKYHSLPEQVADYLFICVENHHERDPLAAIAVVFNACVHLEGSFSEREIELIWQSVMERFPYQEVPDSRSKEFLLKVMVCIVKDKIPFGVVRTLVAFGGFVQLGMPKSMAGDEGINIRKHNGKPCLQIRSSPNYILVPFNSCFEILLEYGLKDSTTREQEASLLSLFESLLEVKEFSEDGDVPLAKHMSRLSLDREAVYLLAEKLSGRKQHYLRVFGFYLSLSLASTNPSSRCLLQHLKHFPEIFSYQSNIPLKKQLVAQVNYLMRQTEYSSLPASENNPITKLYDHATKRASVTSQLLVWILALAQTQDSKMLHLSFELWERYAPKCSTKQRNQLGVKLLFQFLPNEISRAQQMLKSLQEEDPRIPFEQELEAWVAIMAAYQNMKSDSFLVGNLLQICQLTENLLDRELFPSGSAAFTRKFSWLLSHIPIPKEFRLVKKLLTRATEKGFLVSSEKEASLSWMQLCEAGLTHPDCGPKDVFAMWDHADQYGIWSSAALPPRYMTLMTSMAERLILSEDAKPMAIDILDSIVQKGVPDESLAKRVSVLALRHMRDLLFCRQSDETFYEN